MNAGELFRRLKHAVQRDRMTRELEEEMRVHREMRAAHLGPEAAQRRFGNTTTMVQQSRDAWGFTRFEDFAYDVRFAVRRIWKQRGVSLTIIGVMGIGIGATTAMFSAVDAAVLRPLPFAKPEQLVVLPFQVPGEGVERLPSKIDYASITKMTDLFSHVAAYGAGGLNMSDNDRPLRLKVGVVTADFFATVGVRPATGRTFMPSEGVPDAPNVAMLSDGTWKRVFGSRSLSGLRITLNQKVYDVVGVMPPGFTFPEESDVWIPMSVPHTAATFEAFRDYVRQTTIARVADNVTVRDAAMQLLARIENSPGQRFPRHPEDNAGWIARRRAEGGIGTPLQKSLVSDRATALYMLMGATAMLLLVACANVTNLLLAQAAVRRREIAIRKVLGATRARIIRQLLTESVLLSLCGALVGIAIAVGAFQALQALMPPSLAGLSGVQIDPRMLSFSTVLAVLAGIVFGLWPAVGSARSSAAQAIKSGDGHGTTAAWSGTLRRVLVGAELALTVVLLIGAGIMLRSFEQIVKRDAGIENVQCWHDGGGVLDKCEDPRAPACTECNRRETLGHAGHYSRWRVEDTSSGDVGSACGWYQRARTVERPSNVGYNTHHIRRCVRRVLQITQHCAAGWTRVQPGGRYGPFTFDCGQRVNCESLLAERIGCGTYRTSGRRLSALHRRRRRIRCAAETQREANGPGLLLSWHAYAVHRNHCRARHAGSGGVAQADDRGCTLS